MKLLKTTILGGVLFLVPFVFIVIMLEKAITMVRLIAAPIKSLLPENDFIGINIIVIVILLFTCFIAGKLAQRSRIARRVEKLDKVLTLHLPGYMQLKSIIGGRFSDEDENSPMLPVLVRGPGGTTRIGFEVDRNAENRVVVFFPGVPNPQSGSAVVYNADDIEKIEIPTHKAMDMLQFYGRGFADLVEEHENRKKA